MDNTESPNIIVRETIDGMPPGSMATDKADAPARRKAREKSPSAVRRPDSYIWGVYLFLILVSVVELFSASSTEVTSGNVYAPLIRHGIFLALGLGIVLSFQKIHYSVFRKLALPMAVLSLGLLIFASFAGVSINGAQRAIRILGVTIQPPEIVKLTAILLLTQVLARFQEPGGVSAKGLVIASAIVFIFGGLVLPNGLTNLVIIMGACICMLLIAGIRFKMLAVVICVYAMVGGLIWGIRSMSKPDPGFSDMTEQTVTSSAGEASAANGTKPAYGRLVTQKNRVQRFLAGVHPTDTINDINRQVIFSKFALANGGLSGRGPGNSRESARLPLAFSDYIYSIIVEDTGLIGGLILLVLYLCLLGRAGIIASRCSRAFPALLVMGCALLIVLQALIHMAIVVGLVPVSGQPLPFISKGGTSILVMSAAIGMMLSVSRYGTTKGNKKEQKAEIKELPAELQADNPMLAE